MRAYVGARGPRIGGLRTFGGLSTHVGPTGLSVWLFVVGLVELLVVALELTARLLRVVVVAVWRLADSAGKAVRAQGHVRRSAGRCIVSRAWLVYVASLPVCQRWQVEGVR
ncbi:MAG: hypothetical protein ACLP3C_24975 [Mycobacterium sp.]|uniref:hypothetical protein n=1 Tax=Mycobacterium sp. TaxID=1785 RepID=UPI003F9489CD